MNFTPLAALFALACTLPASAAEIIGHRGASSDAPENTVASFKLGYTQKADACELDIYLTADGQVAVIHDSDTQRTTGVPGKVAQATMPQLQALDAGAWKGEQWKGEKIPTLAEALATVPKGRRMFVEIKCGPEVLPALEQTITASGLAPAQIALIGFSYATMAEARKRFPHHQVYWLIGKNKEQTGDPAVALKAFILQAQAAAFDGLDLDWHWPLDPAAVSGLHAAGLKVYVWTVDDLDIARQLAQAGVDGITTNRAGWLKEQLP